MRLSLISVHCLAEFGKTTAPMFKMIVLTCIFACCLTSSVVFLVTNWNILVIFVKKDHFSIFVMSNRMIVLHGVFHTFYWIWKSYVVFSSVSSVLCRFNFFQYPVHEFKLPGNVKHVLQIVHVSFFILPILSSNATLRHKTRE